MTLRIGLEFGSFEISAEERYLQMYLLTKRFSLLSQ